MLKQLIVLIMMLFKKVATIDNAVRKAQINSYENSYLPRLDGETLYAASMLQCSQRCMASVTTCIGANVKTSAAHEGYECEIVRLAEPKSGMQEREGWVHMEVQSMAQSKEEEQGNKASCKAIKQQNKGAANGVYMLSSGNREFEAYCDMVNGGFTLAARFSNADQSHWVSSSGAFWYTNEIHGEVSSSKHNSDMINLAFAVVKGNDIKVSRSDDSDHTALLLASDCLKNKSLRKKITSFGDFRYGSTWKRNQCLGSCSVIFSGMYATTSGFKRATSSCTSGNDILNGYNIGFWCHYTSGDGSVLMIGGGGESCDRADHGIGITEANSPMFDESEKQLDFGDDGNESPTTSYALNLWVY